MPVGEKQGTHVLAVIFQVSQVRRDDVYAKQVILRKHHTGVDDNDVVSVADRHHIHPELAEPAEGDDL